MKKNLSAAFMAAVFFAIAALSAAPQSGHAQATPPPVRAAFVYVTPLLPTGWVHQHELGRQQAQKTLGKALVSSYAENVPEGADAERVIRELAQQGNDIIFTPSFGYMEATLKVAQEFPQVRFESVTGYKTAHNVAAVNARYYEGRYLAGVLAGHMSKTGRAGFVAGFPIPEVIQGINAFTLGMRSVTPDATVRVIWLGTWFDPARERDAAMTLFNQQVDVITFNSASSAVMLAAQERGKYAIGYHSDFSAVAPDAQIAAVKHLWGAYYTQRIRAVQNCTWQPTQQWNGIAQGMVEIADFGPQVPAKVRETVLTQQQQIAKGLLQPFAALKNDIRDNKGNIAIAAGQRLSDAQILQMNWLCEGVLGDLPR